MPNAANRDRLQMAADEPALIVIRRTWSKGRPVTFARLHHPGSRYELTGQYQARETPAEAGVIELENLTQ